MVFKLGLDYKSYYQLPCEPPTVKAGGCGGCPGCSPSTIFFNQTLAWLKNYSVLVDGLPITPILVGWQGNGHDSLYPGTTVWTASPCELVIMRGGVILCVNYMVSAVQAWTW